ncbi:MAG: hypothetical protein ACJ74Z_07635 [Bryobacteraceae bacterium]
MTGLIARSSTIFIAIDTGTHVYRSMAEVPAPLRRKLRSSTTGINSATILIADKRGREELVRALKGQPSEVWSLLAATESGQVHEPRRPIRRRLPSVRTWLEMFLPVAIGASLWLLIDSHF